MKRVCVIDGGGAKGVIALTVIKNIEEEVKKPLREIFDMVVATSVGAVIGGILSATDLPAKILLEEMLQDMPEVFKRRLRIPILQPKYDRGYLSNFLKRIIGEDTLMSACKCMFMCTSTNMVDGRTHFFKSWEQEDGQMKLVKAINRSYAAPLYFGAIKDPENDSVWIDGGAGMMNSPVTQAFIEILRQQWVKPDEKVHVLSLGCGQSDPKLKYEEAIRYRNIRQILYYADPVEGGLARVQSVRDQNELLRNICDFDNQVSFQRVEDYNMPKELNKMDKVKHRYIYKEIGEDLSKQVDYDPLVDLC